MITTKLFLWFLFFLLLIGCQNNELVIEPAITIEEEISTEEEKEESEYSGEVPPVERAASQDCGEPETPVFIELGNVPEYMTYMEETKSPIEVFYSNIELGRNSIRTNMYFGLNKDENTANVTINILFACAPASGESEGLLASVVEPTAVLTAEPFLSSFGIVASEAATQGIYSCALIVTDQTVAPLTIPTSAFKLGCNSYFHGTYDLFDAWDLIQDLPDEQVYRRKEFTITVSHPVFNRP